jgi:hypothetical protein
MRRGLIESLSRRTIWPSGCRVLLTRMALLSGLLHLYDPTMLVPSRFSPARRQPLLHYPLSFIGLVHCSLAATLSISSSISRVTDRVSLICRLFPPRVSTEERRVLPSPNRASRLRNVRRQRAAGFLTPGRWQLVGEEICLGDFQPTARQDPSPEAGGAGGSCSPEGVSLVD